MPCAYCHGDQHNYRTCPQLESYSLDQKKQLLEQKKRQEREMVVLDRRRERERVQRERLENIEINRMRRLRDRERLERERVRIQREREVRTQRRKQWCRQILAEMVTETTNIYPEYLHDYLERPNLIMNMLSSREVATIILNTTCKLRESNKELTPIKDEVFVSDSCPICMGEFEKTDIITTRCGHQFHGTCLFKHLTKHDNCPCCRGVIL